MFNLNFTTMKKLFFLVSFMAFIGLSSAWAQDATQYPGETHKFKVDLHTGSTYDWGIYTDASLGTEITYTNVASLTNEGSNEVSVTWLQNASGTYYVGVTETIGTCSTKRYSQINIVAAAYDLMVENKDGSNNIISQTSCMTGAGRIFTMSQVINPLDNDLYYKITLLNGASPYTNGNWTFDYAITVKDKNTTPADKSTALSATATLVSTGTGMPTISALTGSDVAVSKQSTFVIKVSLKDNPGTASTDDIEVELTLSDLKVGPGQVIETTTGTPAANNYKYTRTTYPNTSAITISE